MFPQTHEVRCDRRAPGSRTVRGELIMSGNGQPRGTCEGSCLRRITGSRGVVGWSAWRRIPKTRGIGLGLVLKHAGESHEERCDALASSCLACVGRGQCVGLQDKLGFNGHQTKSSTEKRAEDELAVKRQPREEPMEQKPLPFCNRSVCLTDFFLRGSACGRRLCTK